MSEIKTKTLFYFLVLISFFIWNYLIVTITIHFTDQEWRQINLEEKQLEQDEIIMYVKKNLALKEALDGKEGNE